MAQFALFLMSTASMFMVCLAASGGGYLVPAAIAASTYTAASVNNAFAARANPFFRVLGSHAACIISILIQIIALKKAPTSPQSIFSIFASLPFLIEGVLSITSLFRSNESNANVLIEEETTTVDPS